MLGMRSFRCTGGLVGIASINYKIEWNVIKLWGFGGTVWQAWYAEVTGTLCREILILELASTSGDVSKLADKIPSSWIFNAGKLACVDTDLTSAILLTPYVNLQHSRTWNVNYGIVC